MVVVHLLGGQACFEDGFLTVRPSASGARGLTIPLRSVEVVGEGPLPNLTEGSFLQVRDRGAEPGAANIHKLYFERTAERERFLRCVRVGSGTIALQRKSAAAAIATSSAAAAPRGTRSSELRAQAQAQAPLDPAGAIRAHGYRGGRDAPTAAGAGAGGLLLPAPRPQPLGEHGVRLQRAPEKRPKLDGGQNRHMDLSLQGRAPGVQGVGSGSSASGTSGAASRSNRSGGHAAPGRPRQTRATPIAPPPGAAAPGRTRPAAVPARPAGINPAAPTPFFPTPNAGVPAPAPAPAPAPVQPPPPPAPSPPSPASASMIPTEDELQVYDVLDPLGEGGQGSLFRGRTLDKKKCFAVKKIMCETVEEKEAFEIRALYLKYNISHDGIVQYLKVESQPRSKQLTILMPLYTEGSLERVIARAPRNGLEEMFILRCMSQVAGALDYLHGLTVERGKSMPMVHRDLKPANILLSEHKRKFVIIDFDSWGKSGKAGTQDLGTQEYMAPESAAGKEASTPADVWSLGVILFILLALPSFPILECPATRELMLLNQDHWGRNPDAFRQAIRRDVLGKYSPGIVDLCLEMLSFEPRKRPSARQVRKRSHELMKQLEAQR